MSTLVLDPVKIVIVGEGGAGKTSVLMGYKNKKISLEWIPTVFDNYIIKVPVNDQEIRVNLWDTAGQEAYDKLRTVTYDGAKLFLLCFDIASPYSLEQIPKKWAPEVRGFTKAPIFLVGNKKDLREDEEIITKLQEQNLSPVTYNEGMKVAKQIGAQQYMECSALKLEGLDELFEKAAKAALPPSRPARFCALI